MALFVLMKSMKAQEIEEIEKAEADRKTSRRNGLSLASIRDRGWIRLNNGALLEWNVDRELEEGEARRIVPKGHFVLTDNNKSMLFNTEEFRKWLRWC